MSVYSADQRVFFSIHLSNVLFLHNVPVDTTAAFLKWGGEKRCWIEITLKLSCTFLCTSCRAVVVSNSSIKSKVNFLSASWTSEGGKIGLCSSQKFSWRCAVDHTNFWTHHNSARAWSHENFHLFKIIGSDLWCKIQPVNCLCCSVWLPLIMRQIGVI